MLAGSPFGRGSSVAAAACGGGGNGEVRAGNAARIPTKPPPPPPRRGLGSMPSESVRLVCVPVLVEVGGTRPLPSAPFTPAVTAPSPSCSAEAPHNVRFGRAPKCAAVAAILDPGLGGVDSCGALGRRACTSCKGRRPRIKKA